MTVKDALYVLRNADAMCLGYDGCAFPFDKCNKLFVDAFLDYVVDEICCTDGCYEIIVASAPLKVGEPG